MLKFYINDNEGSRIQCVAWADARGGEALQNIQRLQLKMFDIVEINGGYARRPLNSIYNSGTSSFELQLYDYTKVTVRGKHELDKVESEVAAIAIEDFADFPDKNICKIEGYVRTPFQKANIINNQGVSLGTYGCGAVTDGTYKLQVHITNFTDDIKYVSGDKIEIIGTADNKGGFYLTVNNSSDMRPLDNGNRMTEDLLLEGFRQPKSKRRHDANGHFLSPTKLAKKND